MEGQAAASPSGISRLDAITPNIALISAIPLSALACGQPDAAVAGPEKIDQSIA